MNVNRKSVAKAVVILVLLTFLPIIGQRFIPSEFIRAFSMQGGIDVIGILYRVAAVGVGFSILVVLRGHVDKTLSRYLWLASAWKVYWLFIVFFLLGLGYPETLGLAVLGGKAEAAENVVIFDFRLFAVLVTAIVVLMIIRSVLQFKEASPTTARQEPAGNPDASKESAIST